MLYVRVSVDPQNAFASADGNLSVNVDGVADGAITNGRRLTAFCDEAGVPQVFSADSHSFDSPEFEENGGPFPGRHAVKGTVDWLMVEGYLPTDFRYIPMTATPEVGSLYLDDATNRKYDVTQAVNEAVRGLALVFEKEVYSAWANPFADAFFDRLTDYMGGKANVTLLVDGFCTGGFCVDGFVMGALERGYRVKVVEDATHAIDVVNAPDGAAYSRETLEAAGAEYTTTDAIIEEIVEPKRPTRLDLIGVVAPVY